MEDVLLVYKKLKMKKILGGLLLLGMMTCISCKGQVSTQLSPKQFQSKIEKDTVQLLDVRTAGEFNSGHIKNAMLADWNTPNEFERRIQYLDKNRPVYVYCLSGGRSAAAAKKLRSSGYTVFELVGGIKSWKMEDLPVDGQTTSKPQQNLETFKTKIASGTVLVDFGAAWCPPCRAMEPVIASVKKAKGSSMQFVEVDGGNDIDIMKVYEVTQLPVFIIFKDGKQVWRKDGIATEKEIIENL